MPRKKKVQGINEQLAALIAKAIEERKFFLAKKLVDLLQNMDLNVKDLEDAQDATS